MLIYIAFSLYIDIYLNYINSNTKYINSNTNFEYYMKVLIYIVFLISHAI